MTFVSNSVDVNLYSDGWFTDVNGGDEVTSATTFARTEDMTLYAHWTLNSYVITFDANGGNADASTLRAYCGKPIGLLPSSTRDYYTFAGWFTDIVDGIEITSETQMTIAEDFIVYAHWTENPISDWVLESELPADARVESEKWTYDKRSEITSTQTSVEGYTQFNSYWKQTSNGSFNYASFPSNYNTNDWYYQNYAKGPYTEYETATSKRSVSTWHSGYIYYHWCYPLSGTHSEYNRPIGEYYNQWISGCGYTTVWEAFASTTDIAYNSGANAYQFKGHSSYSWWWFKTPYYTCSYTDYTKYFQYYRFDSIGNILMFCHLLDQ